MRLDASPELKVEGWRGYLADPDLERDSRTIAQTGAPGHFFGGVQPWSSRERRADPWELTGARREWFLYCEAATWFHRNSGRHFYVTAEPRLLRQLRAPATAANWRDRRIVTVAQALRYLGLLMISRNELYLEVRGGYTRTADAYQLYFELSHALAPARLRLHRRLEHAPSDLQRDELGELEQSIFARVMDLLRARDCVCLVALRTQQNWATGDETLYHLRAATLSATALIDSIAVFAQRALRIPAKEVGGVSGVSLNNRKFRKRLRDDGAGQLADTARRASEFWQAMNALRNPIAHTAGLGGVNYQVLGRASESRITLRATQADAIPKAARAYRVNPSDWGLLSETKPQPLLEPSRFLSQFALTAIAIADGSIAALADDLQAPPGGGDQSAAARNDLPKLALLAGVAERLR